MTQTPAAPQLPPPPGALRWSVLVLLSVAMFGNYYAYDAVGPLADHLQKFLGFTDTQIGTLNAIYSFPNIIMVLIGGIIVDRLGTRRATLGFTLVCMLGAILTAISSNFYVMASGRLIFGLGAESMIVAITTALGQWFVGRQLGFAFGVNLSIARAGSYAADMSPTWAEDVYAKGWQPPLLLAVALCAVGLIGTVGYYVVEVRASKKYHLAQPTASERINWADLVRFDKSFWYVTGLCVLFYSVIFPFRSTFAIKFFQDANHLSLAEAGQLNSYVFLAAIFATPAFGLLVDRVGRRALFMAGGSMMLFLVFPILAYTSWNQWIATALMGVAFSLVPAVLWPAVAHLVEAKRLGTAYGLMTMVQNIGMMVFNVAAGALNDTAKASATNPQGYLPMLWMFGIMSLLSFGFAIALRIREAGPKGHQLELAPGKVRHAVVAPN